MIDPNTYKNTLDSTVIPQGLGVIDQNSRLLTLDQYVQKNLPTKLYRYRKCSERQLDEFYNDKISFAPGTEMNDDFEAMAMFNKEELRHLFDDSVKQAKAIDINQGVEKAADMVSSISKKFDADAIKNQFQAFPQNVIENFFNEILSIYSLSFDKIIEAISATIQEQSKFSCFCDDIISDIMWGHYSDSSKGFAIEYRFSDNKITATDDQHSTHIWGSLYPILYTNIRLECTDFIKNMCFNTILRNAIISSGKYSPDLTLKLIPQLDVFMSKKIALYKSSEWSYEREWRMFFDTDNIAISNEKYPFIKYAPSGIYLGRRISSLNQKVLTGLANEKGIPVYKMCIDNDSKDYKLKYDQV